MLSVDLAQLYGVPVKSLNQSVARNRARFPEDFMFQLTREEAVACSNWALRWSCQNGHLAVAQWLTDRFRLTREDAVAHNNSILRGSCEKGHLAIAQWLTDRFQLTRDDVLTDSSYALRWSYRNGHLGVAQWLVDQGIESISLNPDSVVTTWQALAK